MKGEQQTDIGIGKLPEQREFKGYSFSSEVVIPLAQAALAGLATAGKVALIWLLPAIVAAFVLTLALDAIGVKDWTWLAIALPIGAWLAGSGIAAFAKFFDLTFERMEREAKSPWTDRPGETVVETRETIRYRFIFVNGRKATAEDATPPTQDVTETVVDPIVLDLAEFTAIAAKGQLARSWWCPPNGRRVSLSSGEVSAVKWSQLTTELETNYGFLVKRGGGYDWCVNAQEAVAFLSALAGGQTELPPYPTQSVTPVIEGG